MDMLETALGPPDAEGIFCTIELNTEATTDYLDRAALLVDQWSKIGVRVQITASDAATSSKRAYDRTYGNMSSSNPVVGNWMTILTGKGPEDYWNVGMYYNEHFNELVEQLLGEWDDAERNPLIKEASYLRLTDAAIIPCTSLPEGIYWWPWLRNYYGETNVQDIGLQQLMAYVWVDQDLKTEMGH